MRTGQSVDKRLNNRGFSLVELVIVIAIMVVLTASSMSIMVAVGNARVKSCAQSVYTALGRVKTNTMAKEMNPDANSCYFSISKASSTSPVVVKEVINGNVIEKQVGNQEINISFKTSSGGAETGLGSAELKCYFDRNSGSVRDISDFESLYVIGSHAKWEVRLYKSTGKMEMIRIN